VPWAVVGTVAAAAVTSGVGALTKPKTPSTNSATAAASPADQNVYAADYNAATNDNQISAQNYQWATGQVANQYNATNQAMSTLAGVGNGASTSYLGTTLPAYQQYGQAANDYNSVANSETRAGQAMADSSAANASARTNALANLSSYGVDPSQTRYGALDLGASIQGAAQTAQAGTASRLNTEGTALGLQANTVQMGAGLGGTATGALGSAVGAGNSTMTASGNLLGTPSTWSGLAGNTFGQAVSAEGGSATAGNEAFNQGQTQYTNNAAQSAGLSSAVGGALGSINNTGTSTNGNSAYGNIGGALRSAYNGLTGTSGAPTATFNQDGSPSQASGGF
jgi:hypothetical protein